MGRSTLVVSALLVGLLVVSGASVPDGDRDLLAASGDRGCESVTPAALQSLAGSIDRALRTARKDATANGTNGEYAVAARNARDLLDRSKQRIEDGKRKLEASDPRVTTFAEGGTIKEHVRSSLDWMSEAGHWALISAAYHKSTDARDTFERTVDALAGGQKLFAESGRCYMSGYL